jgi:hypothetical protein
MNTPVLVLCIPRVFDGVSDTDIYNTFNKLNMGIIQKVEIVSNKYNTFKRGFVYYKTWNNHSETAKQAMERFESGNDIKIIYNHPWFWKVSISNCVGQGRPRNATKDIYIKK